MKEGKVLRPLFTPFAYVPLGHKVFLLFFWIIVVILMWQQAGDPVPHPGLVFNDLYDFCFNNEGEFWQNLGTSLILTLKAMVCSIILASILAYLSVIGFVRGIVNIFVKVRYMSMMGFMFVFIIMIHSTDTTKLTSMMFGIVPFFALSMLTVISRIEPCEYDLWTILGFTKWQQVWQIIIKGKLDFLIEAVRTNFAICWIMITMVETQVISDGGLGVLLYKNRRIQDLDKQFAIQIVIFGLGILFDYLLQQSRYKAFPYVKLSEFNK